MLYKKPVYPLQFTGSLTPLPDPDTSPGQISIYVVDPYTNTFKSKTHLYTDSIAFQPYPPYRLSSRLDFFIYTLNRHYIYPDPNFSLFSTHELLLLTGPLPSELL